MVKNSWDSLLSIESEKPYFKDLMQFLKTERMNGKKIYPKEELIFEALAKTPLENVKVVIVGQDPYHQEGQAEGLAFSVPKNIAIPPSLRNIFKEIESDLKVARPSHGSLHSWASQGVLLLNTTLTVEDSKPLSHQKKGWEKFTDTLLTALFEKAGPLVFLLWGNEAKSIGERLLKEPKADKLILESAHPSPLSASRGFFGCRHFSKTNDFLISHNLKAIDWNISLCN